MTINAFLKNYILYMGCLYTIPKLNKQSFSISYLLASAFVFSPLFTVTTLYLKSSIPEFAHIIPFCSLDLVILILYGLSFVNALYLSIIAYTLNILFFHFILTIASVCLLPFTPSLSSIFLFASTVIISIVYILFTIFICSRPRIQTVFSLLQSRTHIFKTLFISFSILLPLTFLTTTPNASEYKRLVIILSITFLTIFLAIWWRSQITKSYREKLRLLEVESLRTSQQEQAKYISQLEHENERMGRIIHKDNRIVNAIADSVVEYLTDATLSDVARQDKGMALAKQIESIRTDRQNILLSKEHIQPNPISPTGYVGVDALVTYMTKEASQHHISLQFDFREDVFQGESLFMSEEDLVHLLSDTLKNAIIATQHNNGSTIKLSILKLKGIPTIAISDSGIPFSIDTYMNLGLEKASTHTDEGGSGIGLLDIWSLKEKYKATLYIEECPASDTFTKQVVFIFDKKNRYMISSKRHKDIQRQQTRADLYVVNPATEGNI